MTVKWQFNPFTGNLDKISEETFNIGGLHDINVETLSDDKTLTPGVDKIYQFFDEGASNRNITLATTGATAGDWFVIKHNGSYNDTHHISIYQAAALLDSLYAGAIKKFIYDGTNWLGAGPGTGDGSYTHKYNTSFGGSSRAYEYGTAFGFGAYGDRRGVGIGYDANGQYYGVAVGLSSLAYNYSIALGIDATARSRGVALGVASDNNSNYYSTALGYRSECTRYCELCVNIDGESDQENQWMIGAWTLAVTDDTPTEMKCGGYASRRFTVRASSHLAFKITVVARDNVSNEGAMYKFEGLIHRDASNNTVMDVCNKTVVHEDDATWDCDVTADDTNEALIITVTGDADNITQWVARLDGEETHF